MQRIPDRAQAPADAPVRPAREQSDDGLYGRGDATLDVPGPLQVDEDTGGDPYNHTGRFERGVR